ncbi:MAG TPA: FG-GAP-like repeat-containing protein [Candidatus Kryptonia bacterium]
MVVKFGVYLSRTLQALVLVLFLGHVAIAQAPTFASFSPKSGPIGTNVTISGTNFNSTASNNVVYVGAVRAIVTSASSTSLSISVPAGATYGPISVTNLATNLTADANLPFDVTFENTDSIDAFSFLPTLDLPTRKTPAVVNISDLDGDGRPDLLLVSNSSGVISFYPNTTWSGNTSFAVEIDSSTGTLPEGLAVADLDGDGKPDVAVVNNLSRTISVYRNTSVSGTISFAARLDFPIAINPSRIAIGDIDGDGKPDLVVTTGPPDSLMVYRNTSSAGNITFAPAVSFPTGSQPASIAISDLDGDGKPDLAVANGGSKAVSIYRNMSTPGSISFAAKWDLSTESNLIDLVVADMDGDGRPDIAVPNMNTNTVSVFRNTSTVGNISFSSSGDLVAGSQPLLLGVGDLDGDGRADLVAVNSGDRTMLVYRNTSSAGNISFTTGVSYSIGGNPSSIALGDLSGDGKPEITITNSTDSLVVVYKNAVSSLPTPILIEPVNGLTGTATNLKFAWAASFGATTYRLQVSADSTFMVNDYDSSGITTASETVKGLSSLTKYYWRVEASNVGGTSYWSSVWSFATGILTISSFSPTSGPIGATVVISGSNFDPTANNDIVCFGAVRATVNSATPTSLGVTVPIGATYQPISVTVNGLTAYTTAPFGVTFPGSQVIDTTSFASAIGFTTGSPSEIISICDLDGDGKPDIVVTHHTSSNTISVYRNISTPGNISFAPKLDFSTGSDPRGLAIRDVDGDGKPDLVITNYASNTVSVFRNTSIPGSISFAPRVDFTTASVPIGVAVEDLDGDGKPELVVTNVASDSVSVFRNTSISGNISFAPRVDFTTGSEPSWVTINDVDGDGKPDLILTNNLSNTVSVFRNTSIPGSISFAPKVDFTTGTYPNGVAVCDVDGDGKPDLVVTNWSSNTVSIFRNTSSPGTVTFSPKVDFTTGSDPTGIAINDLNGDGKPDLAVTSNLSNTVSVFKNTSVSGSITTNLFAPRVDFATGTYPVWVDICDVDGDGKPDLIVTDWQSSSFSVFRNAISGSLSAPTLAIPANGSTGVSINPTLTWNASTGATAYRLQVSTDSTFATTTCDVSGLDTTSKSISGLAHQTKYYWRVNADSATVTSGWSATWSFTTTEYVTWTQINNGLTSGQTRLVFSFAIDSSGYIFAGTDSGGVYISTDNGTSWVQKNNGLQALGYISSFALNSSGDIFAGVYYGGIYLSTNRGASWTQVSNGVSNGGAYSLAINSSGYIFAGTYGAGVYLSTNNGTSWTQINNGLTDGYVGSLAINSAGYIFAGTVSGAFLSTNNGTSWTQVSNGLGSTNRVFSLAINSAGYIFAGTTQLGVYLSTNNGTSWTQVSNGLPSSNIFSLAVSSSGNIFAGTNGGGVYLSTNNGMSWTQVNNGLTNSVVQSLAINYLGYIFAGTNGSGIYRADISSTTPPPAPALSSPPNGSIGTSTNLTLSWAASVGVLSYGLQISTDSTFATMKYDTSNLTITSMILSSLSFSTKYYWRVNVTDSAGTSAWSKIWSFTTAAAQQPPSVPVLVSPVNGQTGVSTNPTFTWNAPLVATSHTVRVPERAALREAGRFFKVDQTELSYRLQVSLDSAFDASVFADTTVVDTFVVVNGLSPQTNYFWRLNATDSAGTSGWSDVWSFTTATQTFWTQINDGLTNNDVSSLAINSSGYIFAGTYGGGICLSTNNGTKWTPTAFQSGNFSSLAVNSAGYIFSGTVGQGMYLSTDNGASWTEEITGWIGRLEVSSIAINPSGYIFAGSYGSGVHLSSDGGASWTQINTGLTNSNVWALAINSSGYIFAGTIYGNPNGIYLSTNSGSNWTEVNNGLTSKNVLSLAINPSGYIFAGTDSGGVYLSKSNGASWTQIVNGLAYGSVWSLAISSNGYIFAGTDRGRVYLSTNNGASWTRVKSGLTKSVVQSITINSSGDVFVGTDESGIYRASISSLLTLIRPAPTLVSPTDGSTGVSTHPILKWNVSGGSTSYELQVSKDSLFASTDFDRSNLTATSQEVTGLFQGTTYYWHVQASDSNGSSGWSKMAIFTTFSYPASIQVSTKYNPPTTMDSSSYQIIGLPGITDIPIGNLMSGKEGPDWKAYYNNGANQNYYVEYNGTSAFNFEPGRAFWILSRNSFSVSQNASTVLIDTADSHPISIHSGWNLISDPFEKSVSWSSVQAMNGTSQPIYAFSNGSYSQPDTMEPYQGYYFYNDTAGSQLRIPYVYSSSVAAASKPADPKGQSVTLAICESNKSQTSITVGVRSSTAFDDANMFAPPGEFQRARICVVDSTIPAGWKELVRDYRDTIGAGQQFDFYVTNKTGKSLNLMPKIGLGLSQYEVYLIDKDLLRSYNLKDSEQISIPAYNKLKNYSILIGGKLFIDAKLAAFLPKGFMLYQNYPNPFNPVTVIRFEVPKAEHVLLTIYDVLGRKVETLVDGNISPGYYEFPFDGTRLSTGVYFYRLSAGSFKQVKKMLLLK